MASAAGRLSCCTSRCSNRQLAELPSERELLRVRPEAVGRAYSGKSVALLLACVGQRSWGGTLNWQLQPLVRPLLPLTLHSCHWAPTCAGTLLLLWVGLAEGRHTVGRWLAWPCSVITQKKHSGVM